MAIAEGAKMNRHGELQGAGPEWACGRFGQDDHDYQTCPNCKEWFGTYMAAKASISRVAA